jgi:hypothetical protein
MVASETVAGKVATGDIIEPRAFAVAAGGLVKRTSSQNEVQGAGQIQNSELVTGVNANTIPILADTGRCASRGKNRVAFRRRAATIGSVLYIRGAFLFPELLGSGRHQACGVRFFPALQDATVSIPLPRPTIFPSPAPGKADTLPAEEVNDHANQSELPTRGRGSFFWSERWVRSFM